MCQVMTIWLTMAGHVVESDTAGSTALPKIAAFDVDAILVDLMMAEVNGLELIEELRSNKSTAKAAIIMVSVRTYGMWFDRAHDAGADDYLTKPLEQASFVAKVESIIAAKMTQA